MTSNFRDGCARASSSSGSIWSTWGMTPSKTLRSKSLKRRGVQTHGFSFILAAVRQWGTRCHTGATKSDRCDAACRSRRTIDFAYDPDEDTAERVADEITSLFELSSTDRDICAAALKEWLAKELPDNDSS